MNRAYISADQVSEALIEAGIEVQPKDCLRTKFSLVAEILGHQMRGQVRSELGYFMAQVLRDSTRAKTVPPTSPDITESSKSENNCSLKENDLQERP